MEIKLNPELLHPIITDAIMRQLDAGARDTLIKQAIEHLMTPIKGVYNNPTSPMDEAFRYASQQVAREIVAEEMKKPEIRDLIAGAVTKAFQKALVQDQDGVIEQMSQAITSAIKFKQDRY